MSSICNGNNSNFDQLDDLPCENVSPDVYIYYLKALGTSPVSFAVVLYIFYQVRLKTNLLLLCSFFSIISFQIFEIASKLWLSAWASSREKTTDYNIGWLLSDIANAG